MTWHGGGGGWEPVGRSETGGGPERNRREREGTERGASEAGAWDSEPEGA